MTGVVLDAGAFIALERRSGTMVELTRRFVAARTPLVTSAGVVAEVWRGGLRQIGVAYLLHRVTVVDMTGRVAKVLGQMLGATGSADPVDAHVVFLARERGFTILTSDPRDLRVLDPKLPIETI